MKIRLFKLPKNKRFNYTPFEMGSRIRKDRETVTNHFTEEWRSIRSESRNRKNAGVNKTFWIVLLVLILITLYFLDFDLSIFRRH